MAQKARDSRLEKRTNRLKLSVGTRYSKSLGTGIALCYRRTKDGFGTWSIRMAVEKNRYVLEALAQADDHQEANGETVLSFEQAQDKALKRNKTVQQAGGIIRTAITVNEAVEHYMQWFRQNRKTVSSTETAINAHILPTFGNLQVASLKTDQFKKWLERTAGKPARKRSRAGKATAYREAPVDDNAKRARKATANRLLSIFKAILNKAYQDDLVASNEAWRKVKPFANADEPIMRFLKTSEATRLINACKPDFRLLIQAALNTGARYSELTGIKVADFSPDSASVFIRPGKSGKGRHIPLTEEGLALMGKAALGKKGTGLVFLRADGAAWGKNYHVRPLLQACKIAKIEPAIGFHELRHTYASLLAQAGADLLTISKLLGHADTRITSRHYAHLCDKTLANAVNRFLPVFAEVVKGKVEAIG